MKTALQIIQFISYSSNAEVSKISSWSAVKNEALNGLNRAIRVLWNSKEWNFRRTVKDKTIMGGGKAMFSSFSIGDNVIGQNGLRYKNKPLIYDREIPFYDEEIGTPTKYYVDYNGKVTVYPIPEERNLVLQAELYSTMPVVSASYDEKSEFTEATDTINIDERLEPLFIDCLNYFCNEILNGDPTDEEYQEHKLRHSEVYKLLEKQDMSSFDNDADNDKGFLMPWQL